MKFLLKTIFIFFIFAICYSTSAIAQNKVQFIYVHGTNDNSYKKHQQFTYDVQNLHPYVLNAFTNSAISQKYLLEDGKYTISEKPTVFYWGAESKQDLNLLSDWLDVTKFFSPKLAQTVRSMSAHVLHDAIWIQKYNNMKPIVEKLHCTVRNITQDGDKFILLGHSAGSFITYEYLLYKAPFVNTKVFFSERNIPAAQMKEIQKIGYRNTCIDALIDSGVTVYKRDNTFYVPKENLVNNYKKLLTVEKTSCVSEDNFAGVINFGSPISLFYSGFAKNTDKLEDSILSFVLNNNIFYLNLNFAEDPLGYPVATENDYIEMLSYKGQNVNDASYHDNYGFIYDKSNLRSNTLVINAHSSYWKKKKFFSKSMVSAYEDAIKIFSNQDNK